MNNCYKTPFPPQLSFHFNLTNPTTFIHNLYNPLRTVGAARSIPHWMGMLAGTKQDILPMGLMIWWVWGCSIDSMMLRAVHSSLSEYLFSPLFQDSILAVASSWAFFPRTTFLQLNDLSISTPEIATNHVVLHTTPIGVLIIQTLLYELVPLVVLYPEWKRDIPSF